jgi:hypothetical protein
MKYFVIRKDPYSSEYPSRKGYAVVAVSKTIDACGGVSEQSGLIPFL